MDVAQVEQRDSALLHTVLVPVGQFIDSYVSEKLENRAKFDYFDQNCQIIGRSIPHVGH